MKTSRTCPCGKRRFRDHQEAVHALHLIANRDIAGTRYPIRSYDCPSCAGWHLTSRM